MTITITLAPATEERLRAQAEATGKDISALVVEAVEAKLARSKKPLREALEPIQDAVAASGMSPEEADAFLERELSAVRADRRASQGPR